MPAHHITFPADGLSLEGLFYVPDQRTQVPGLVICHPHPLRGGDMYNNVVMGLANAFIEAGHAVVCFNFRGVGKSTGSHGEGIAEQEDAKGALTWMAAQTGVDAERLLLAGYSFGARVALSVTATDPRVKGIIAVAPPVSRSDLPSLEAHQGPKLFFCGDADPVCPAEALTALVGRLPEPKGLFILPGGDHFFVGKEAALGQRAVTWLREHI